MRPFVLAGCHVFCVLIKRGHLQTEEIASNLVDMSKRSLPKDKKKKEKKKWVSPLAKDFDKLSAVERKSITVAVEKSLREGSDKPIILRTASEGITPSFFFGDYLS